MSTSLSYQSLSSAGASFSSSWSSANYAKGHYLEALQELDLASFFQSHDRAPKKAAAAAASNFASLGPTKAIDFIHFIWMGNPIKESDTRTISAWKREYPAKQIVLWVDKKALEFEGIKQFAQDNDIRLIDVEEIFTDEYSFGLSKYFQLEKNRLPPNWGAVSDMYRYLIIYWFAGIYSDTDRFIKDFYDDIYFTDLTILSDAPGICRNDLLITKKIRDPFWKHLLEEIKSQYPSPISTNSRFRLLFTLRKTGPVMLYSCYKKASVKPCMQEVPPPARGNYSWRATLTEEKCESLS